MHVSMPNGDEAEMELAPMQRQVHRYAVVKTSRLRLRAVTVVAVVTLKTSPKTMIQLDVFVPSF